MKAHGFDSCDVLKIDVEGFEYPVLKPLLIKPSFGRAWCSSNTMNNEILATSVPSSGVKVIIYTAR